MLKVRCDNKKTTNARLETEAAPLNPSHKLKWPKSTFLLLDCLLNDGHRMPHARRCRMWPKRLGRQQKFIQQLLGTAFNSGSYDAFKSQTTHWGLEQSWRSALSSDVGRRKQQRSSLPNAQHGSWPNSGGWYTGLGTFLDIRIFAHPTQGTSREWSLDYTSINSLAAQPDSCTAGKRLQRQRYMRVMEQSLHLRREKGRFCFASHDSLFSPHEWFTMLNRNK